MTSENPNQNVDFNLYFIFNFKSCFSYGSYKLTMLLQPGIVNETLLKCRHLARFTSFETANHQKHVYCVVQ